MSVLSVHLTDKCNSKCIFCIVDAPYTEKEYVKSENILTFLQANSDKGYKAVNIHGGEPTIRPDFYEILDEIVNLGYPEVWLQTNARSLSSMKLAKKMVDNRVNLFIISMHGKDAETQDGISLIKNSFDQAVQGIRNVKSLGAKVRTNTVVCNQNYKTLPDIASFVLDLGVDHVNISAIHTAGTAFRNFELVTPTYDEIQPYVFETVERVLAADKVITLEGFPYCTISGYEKYMIDWSEKKYKMLYRNYLFEDYSKFMDDHARVKHEMCLSCVYVNACGGVYKEYIDFFGWTDEFNPVSESDAELMFESNGTNKVDVPVIA